MSALKVGRNKILRGSINTSNSTSREVLCCNSGVYGVTNAYNRIVKIFVNAVQTLACSPAVVQRFRESFRFFLVVGLITSHCHALVRLSGINAPQFRWNPLRNYMSTFNATNISIFSPFNGISGLAKLGIGLPRPEKEAENIIADEEVQIALRENLELLKLSEKEKSVLGWRLVQSDENGLFALFKRVRGKGQAAEYLMQGFATDISPRTFFCAQVEKDKRGQWDKTMMEMSTLMHLPESGAKSPFALGSEKSQDVIYYRTKWPWPLKDRDYVLARRCRHVHEFEAISFASKSTESVSYPLAKGAIRVDRYWCHSTFIPLEAKHGIDQPGMRFLTRFCDDQKVSLPDPILDLISSHAEKMVPPSINRLYRTARHIQGSIMNPNSRR